MPVSFRDWCSRTVDEIRSDGKRGLLHAAYSAYLGLWYTASSRFEPGRNVYDEPWDLLVVLDGCRVDALEQVRAEYDFLGSVERRTSVGSHSKEWLSKTFTAGKRDAVTETVMITGNGHTEAVLYDREYPPDETVPLCLPRWDVVDGDDFRHLEQLWKYDHGEGLGIPPRPVTDRVITAAREHRPDRLIAHYMQPHIPYIAAALEDDRPPTEDESKGWKRLETGDLDADSHWDLYLANLRLVLDDVGLLLENVAADRVCITADHGNLFGEAGAYGHPEGFPHPDVKRVPWVETSAVDTGSYSPTYELPDRTQVSVEERLADLGYV